jgi:hypothetical protein
MILSSARQRLHRESLRCGICKARAAGKISEPGSLHIKEQTNALENKKAK